VKHGSDNPETLFVDDIGASIALYTSEFGYRLDMIVPADSPAAALLSRGSERIRLEKSGPPAECSDMWITGRAGMMYRDLIPGRLGGKLIASHIRLTEGGDVPDYVHYHKVRFQMIYCVRGAIRVVYEDQGEPFWLHPGDCVLQPPEIRHRVLWAEARSEVVELGLPAVHETWVEHEITLPTAEIKPDRVFHGQRFARHIAADHLDESVRDTGLMAATDGFADVKVIRYKDTSFDLKVFSDNRQIIFCFVLAGKIKSTLMDGSIAEASAGGAFICDSERIDGYECVEPSEVLLAAF